MPACRRIVVVNGWGMPRQVWRPLLDCLPPGTPVQMVDPPMAPDWETRLLAQAPDEALWLGWSLGGMMTLAMAARHPKRVQGMITLATAPRFVEGPAWPVAMSVEVFNDFLDRFDAAPEKAWQYFIGLQLQGQPTFRQTLRSLLGELPKPAAADWPGLGFGLELLQTLDLRDELRQCTVSGLHLLDGRDALLPAKVGEAINRLNPRQQVEILPELPHFPFAQGVEQVGRRVVEFFQLG